MAGGPEAEPLEAFAFLNSFCKKPRKAPLDISFSLNQPKFGIIELLQLNDTVHCEG